jgi:hypothetical protein
MASSYHQLGVLAHLRGDYVEAARQYQRSLDIDERLGDQTGMAATYSQLGNLESERGGQIATATAWQVRALLIRLALGVPQAATNLRRLGEYRRELGADQFTSLLNSNAGDPSLVETITDLLDQAEEIYDPPV